MMQKILLLVLVIWSISSVSLAALPEKLQYDGVRLGDSYAVMEERLGEPIVGITRNVADTTLLYYTYRHNDVWIGIDAESGKIMDMIIRDKDYCMDGNIRLGATIPKLIREYGRGIKVRYNGLTQYAYQIDTTAGGALYFEINEGYVREIRMSNLKLIDFEEQR